MDIGAGYGKYGVLTRLYLEANRYEKEKWHLTIDAIEIFPPYLEQTKHFYNTIIYQDALTQPIEGYDLVFLFDILEHFEKETALQFLERIIRHNRAVLISTPLKFFPQDAHHGNIYQIHKCVFQKTDFERLALSVKIIDSVLFAYSKNLKFNWSIKKRLKRKIPRVFRKRLLRIVNASKYDDIYG